MTRVFDADIEGGKARLLVIGAGHYENALVGSEKVPQLPNISSAAQTALDVATEALMDWADRLVRPLGTVDLLASSVDHPDGLTFTRADGQAFQLEVPTLSNIRTARAQWLAGAGPDDLLIFYCCGHGIGLPATSTQTLLAADFGVDPDDPWPWALSLSDFGLALIEKPPRLQWLFFDCCANTPTEALEAMAPKVGSLLSSSKGGRGRAERLYGPAAQAIVAAAPFGTIAYGKTGRGSRMSVALIEACSVSGYRAQDDQGKWLVDTQSLDTAMSSYAERVAPTEEQAYFTFSRLVTTDAQTVPILMSRDEPPTCMLCVVSEPAQRLKDADLHIACEVPPGDIGHQDAGPAALARYRVEVEPWRTYQVDAHFPTGQETRRPFAQPPIARVKF